MDKVYTVADLADLLKVSRTTIMRYVRQKKIDSFRVGNFIRFTQAMVDDFIRRTCR